MEIDEYRAFVDKTAIPPCDSSIPYLALALCGEAGEVAEKVKKIQRDRGGLVTDDAVMGIALELGDCLYYLTRLASVLGFPLSRIAELNRAKVERRIETDTLHGSGDYRELTPKTN